jgi:hypothetical protein
MLRAATISPSNFDGITASVKHCTIVSNTTGYLIKMTFKTRKKI